MAACRTPHVCLSSPPRQRGSRGRLRSVGLHCRGITSASDAKALSGMGSFGATYKTLCVESRLLTMLVFVLSYPTRQDLSRERQQMAGDRQKRTFPRPGQPEISISRWASLTSSRGDVRRTFANLTHTYRQTLRLHTFVRRTIDYLWCLPTEFTAYSPVF
ncbi:hypothetical protein Bbelb_363280 [Branchiostoma belcheri]|nr:hypothetical protein Bbelb_363280 [Branchiostoma belcheri]